MKNECPTLDALSQEIRQLRSELAEAYSIINAIKRGETDALLISGKMDDHMYILKGADHIYRVIVEKMQEGCATIASDGIILFCNKNLADIVKMPLERVIGSSIYDFLQPPDRKTFASFLSAHTGSFKTECSLKAATFYAPVIMSASSIAIDGDTLTCLVVSDLTEQRRSELFAEIIFSQAKEPIIACDSWGRITQANPAAVSMFEWPLVGNLFDTVIPLFRASDGTSISLSQVINSTSSYGVEVQYGRRGGRPLTLLMNAGKFNAKDKDKLVGCVVMLTDITDKCMFADQLARLDRLNIIGEIAAGIGHEVRNPLTTVRGYLQMFSRKAKYADDNEQLELMIEELDRANSIITDFLAIAKTDSVELTPGNLNGTIHALFPLLQADAFRLGHQIQADVGDIPVIRYDDKEIRQLILNLVRNALEAMESSGVVTIRTYTENDKLILSVKDTGTGISEEVLSRLGTPFVTTKEAGTGLGLSICYRIAAKHDAKVEIETSLLGTTFFVMFNYSKTEG